MKIQSVGFIKVIFITITLSLVIHTFSYAEEQSQQVPPYQVYEAMEQMMPAMIRMMVDTMLDIYSDPTVAEKEATYAKNLYDALLKKGFSKEEAINIVVAFGNPITFISNE